VKNLLFLHDPSIEKLNNYNVLIIGVFAGAYQQPYGYAGDIKIAAQAICDIAAVGGG